ERAGDGDPAVHVDDRSAVVRISRDGVVAAQRNDDESAPIERAVGRGEVHGAKSVRNGEPPVRAVHGGGDGDHREPRGDGTTKTRRNTKHVKKVSCTKRLLRDLRWSSSRRGSDHR